MKAERKVFELDDADCKGENSRVQAEQLNIHSGQKVEGRQSGSSLTVIWPLARIRTHQYPEMGI